MHVSKDFKDGFMTAVALLMSLGVVKKLIKDGAVTVSFDKEEGK